jgi:cyclophilin family peptidyl-prolyl cis-trans isomerase
MKFSRAVLPAAALVLIGAGCASSTPAPSAPRTTDASQLTVPTTPAPAPAPAPTSNPTPKPIAMEKTWSFPGILPENQIKDRQIRMQTSKGEIVFELFEDEAPKTVSNFVYLTKGGYYDNLTFHRRVEGFVIQGGDPSGNGTGGPGYRFEDEPVKRAYDRGIVAMANAGPDTNGSQFFIMLADTPLPPAYTIFGKVTKGMDVVDAIKVGDVMTSVIVEAKSK